MGKMKANRKFVDGEEAVSAVIGVILMVAITVAIAATVYVYVSGMMGTENEATPVITFQQQDTALTNTLTIISADPGDLVWADLQVKINGTDAADPADYSVSGGTQVEAGNVITFVGVGNYTVAISHTPSNTLVGTWDYRST